MEVEVGNFCENYENREGAGGSVGALYTIAFDKKK